MEASISQNKKIGIKRKLTINENKKKKTKTPLNTIVSNEEDAVCSGCQEKYSVFYGTGDWVICAGCKSWWHEDCSNYLGQKQFNCDLCI